MKVSVSAVLVGCSLLVAGIEAKHRNSQSKYEKQMRRTMREQQCMSCGMDSETIPTHQKKMNVPKEFYRDPELYTMGMALPENGGEVEPMVPEVDTQSTLVVRFVRNARRAQCGPYIFVNTILGRPELICGAFGYLSAAGEELTGANAVCSKKCGYTFHKSRFCLSGGDSCKNDDSSSSSITRSHSSSSDPCNDSVTSMGEPEGVWKHRCRRVTLCKEITCTCCKAPTYLYFDDLCPGIGGTPSTDPPVFTVFLYHGFLLYGGAVLKGEACTAEDDDNFHTGVISPLNVLQINGSTPFVLFRFRPYTLKCIFITYCPNRALEPTPVITVEIIGKRLGRRKAFYHQLTLWRDQPRAFTPKHGFDDITKLSVKTQSGVTHQIAIDNIILCA